jgi:hypothetical protein
LPVATWIASEAGDAPQTAARRWDKLSGSSDELRNCDSPTE